MEAEVETDAPAPTADAVELRRELLDEIARHGETTFPDECCGMLLGRIENGVRVIERLMPIDNQWDEGERRRRFLIQPADVLKAEREARRHDLDVLGCYHSHPNAPARPSDFDREHAWPWYTYLIASIRDGHYDTIAGWQLRDDRTGYDEVVMSDE